MHTRNAVSFGVLAILSTVVNAQQQNETCKPQQAALAAIQDKYKPQYDDISKRGKDLEGEAPKDGDKVTFNVKVDMKEQRWVLKLPSVTMKRNEIVVGLPQVSMKTQSWSYDTPVTRMVTKKIGQKPEFTCKKDNWGIPYDCRTVWTDILTDVPETTMQTTQVKLDIPETTWKDTKMSWDVPTLTWVENVWFVKVPEFTLVNVAIDKGKDLQAKSDGLNKDIAGVNASRISDTRGATTALYTCFRADLQVQQGAAEKQLDDGINTLNSSIQTIRAQGADPTKVPSGGAQAINLVATLADMVAKRSELTTSFDNARALMNSAEKDALNKLQ